MTMPTRWGETGLPGFSGRVRFLRRFGYPGRIDEHERVWLTFAGADHRAEVWLNETMLGAHEGSGAFEFEVTALLCARNELRVEVEGTAEQGGLWGEVALEVRCTAYLRGVRFRATTSNGRVTLHVTGQVVGTAPGPLELYAVLGRSPVAYATVVPTPEGTDFHLTGEAAAQEGTQAGGAAQAGEGLTAKVDLVNTATVWYTLESGLECESVPSEL
jgi:hypothetical protein